MFITRKEFEEEKQNRRTQNSAQWKLLEQLGGKINSLAKELGYEYVSEVVKEQGCHKEGCWCGGSFRKSVLRYSWKKIKK